MVSDCNFQPAIVIAAYNRPDSLNRLLNSLARANYPQDQDVPIVISIDHSDCSEITQIADNFIWQFGTKQVIKHEKNLGLKAHIIQCGDLTTKYNSIILLEDDLLVSPCFYDYTIQALKFYNNCDRISGISLYSYFYNEYAKLRFLPLDDGFDNYFLQSATSWGQCWTRKQWQNFKIWYQDYGNISIDDNDYLPEIIIKSWSEQSWKNYFIKYMICNDKYFVVPRISLTTNFSDIGSHVSVSGNDLQAPLIIQNKPWRFSYLSESKAIYDSHYEILPSCLIHYNSSLKYFDFECDLYGTKNLTKLSTEYLITIRNSRSPEASYALALKPQELNIALALEGDFFNLTKVKDCERRPYHKKISQFISLNQKIRTQRLGALFFYSLINEFRKG